MADKSHIINEKGSEHQQNDHLGDLKFSVKVEPMHDTNKEDNVSKQYIYSLLSILINLNQISINVEINNNHKPLNLGKISLFEDRMW